MGSAPTSQHLTIGSIADRLCESFPRIAYIITSRRIAPFARAGIVRLFDESALEQVRTEIAKIHAKRSREVRTT